MHSGPDLTPGVETGLAIFYLVVTLANVAYGFYQHVVAKNARQGFLWYAVGAFLVVYAAIWIVVGFLLALVVDV